jgi:hypothetical protein
MHHTRIEVQKAHFQYIKVEPKRRQFNPSRISSSKEEESCFVDGEKRVAKKKPLKRLS